MEQMIYRIGLDIGIASVGWCVMECDENGEPKRIADLGSRIFDVAEVPKTGEPLAKERRDARGLRRRLRRKAFRLERLVELFKNNGVEIDFEGEDVNYLRVKALDEKISENDFARVLYLLCKNRGFKSNCKSDEDDKEGGKLLKAAKANDQMMAEKGYRTIGEMLYRECVEEKENADGEKYFVYNTRNHGGEYTKTVYRATLQKEIELLFEKQAEFGNKLATDDIKKAYLGNPDDKAPGKKKGIFNAQRNFDEGPGEGSNYSAEYKVGKCTFEDENRAPKASYSVELSVALQKMNNLSICRDGEVRALCEEERKIVRALIDKQVKVSYAAIRKALKLDDEYMFNVSYPRLTKKDVEKGKTIEDIISDYEKKNYLSNMEKSRAIRNALNEENQNDFDLVDEIAVVLAMAKSDEKREKLFAENEKCKVLTREEIDNLLKLTFDKFAMLGFTATRKIIPYLEEGMKYSDACAAAGYNHSVFECERTKQLNTAEIHNKIAEITSPVVKRSITQTLKVVNSIIAKYGSPVAVNIELARDMSRNRQERDKVKRENDARYAENQKFISSVKDKTGINLKKGDLLKYRLYEEQQCKCAYCGKPINLNAMFEDNAYQVDHVMPYSRTFNDSFNNKVLVCTKCNQDKGNRLPYEYMNESQFADFESRVEMIYKNNFDKKQILLKKKLDENEWKSRALNDTRYISRFVSDLIGKHLLFDTRALKTKRVFVYNGQMTSYVRRNWGIVKIREDGDFHHAVDAAVIACMTDAMNKKIAEYNQEKEVVKIRNDFYDAITGEQVDRLPLPYDNFRKELVVRCKSDLDEIKNELKEKFNYTDEQLVDVKVPVASRMQIRKAKGQIHDDTIRSAKYYKEQGFVVTKTDLTKLKLTKDGKDIEGYFNPESDRLLYEHLLKLLQENGGNAAQAFGDKVIRKPCADGTEGNIVKKVKIKTYPSLGVTLDKVKGFAANGSMYRVDVFRKDGKYYCVPVYLADVYRHELPNKAATAGKSYEEWTEIDDTFDFKFSMYPNDLLFVENKKGLVLSKKLDNEKSKLADTLEFTSGYVYFRQFNISTASALVTDVLDCYFAGIGLKMLTNIQKCQIDVLGNVTVLEKDEIRQPL